MEMRTVKIHIRSDFAREAGGDLKLLAETFSVKGVLQICGEAEIFL